MEQIDYDVVKATAFTTYRCWRGCLLGHVSQVPRFGVVWSHRIQGQWKATQVPWEEPLYVACKHLKGALPGSDRAQGVVILNQEDVRTVEKS